MSVSPTSPILLSRSPRLVSELFRISAMRMTAPSWFPSELHILPPSLRESERRETWFLARAKAMERKQEELRPLRERLTCFMLPLSFRASSSKANPRGPSWLSERSRDRRVELTLREEARASAPRHEMKLEERSSEEMVWLLPTSLAMCLHPSSLSDAWESERETRERLAGDSRIAFTILSPPLGSRGSQFTSSSVRMPSSSLDSLSFHASSCCSAVCLEGTRMGASCGK
mmetsp:Transcript_22407/g.73581  ORF Transcript_22407/g.73581 Transcript_22407/m.73581 type:complete len:230 (-) Transcript_22407:273-962(-)